MGVLSGSVRSLVGGVESKPLFGNGHLVGGASEFSSEDCLQCSAVFEAYQGSSQEVRCDKSNRWLLTYHIPRGRSWRNRRQRNTLFADGRWDQRP